MKNNPTEQPAPVVTDRHREVFQQAADKSESEFHQAFESGLGTHAEAREIAYEAGATVLARAFPIQVPTTDRPTVPGVFWYRNRPQDEWVLVSVRPLLMKRKLSASSNGCPIAWVDDMTGEWLRIPTPDELAGKGAA